MKKIKTLEIFSNGISIGLKNLLSLLGAVVLWILTIWIPYLNVGTTIAICSLPLEMAKGRMFSPIVIFHRKYRELMGDFFLLMVFMYCGIIIGMIFLFIPGIVIAISWSLALLFMIDKNKNPIKALKISNLVTLGNKWQIFFAYCLLCIPYLILVWLFNMIPYVGMILVLIVALIYLAACLGMQAYIYRELSSEEFEGQNDDIIVEEVIIA
jgi:hypothetical protein